jgi:hypothetical protein
MVIGVLSVAGLATSADRRSVLGPGAGSKEGAGGA